MASLWGKLSIGYRCHSKVANLAQRGDLPQEMVPTAIQLWDDTRAKGKVHPAAVLDDLLVLTMLLANYYGKLGDHAKLRALLETALDSSHTPAHIQYMRGALCRAAVSDGDDNAAAGWLALCDPQPADLMSDTAYRMSYSFLATVQGRFDMVMQALGDRPDSFPLFSGVEVLCGLVRANAFERRGDVSTAVAQLKAFIAADRDAAIAFPRMARTNFRLDLCPQSLAYVLR